MGPATMTSSAPSTGCRSITFVQRSVYWVPVRAPEMCSWNGESLNPFWARRRKRAVLLWWEREFGKEVWSKIQKTSFAKCTNTAALRGEVLVAKNWTRRIPGYATFHKNRSQLPESLPTLYMLHNLPRKIPRSQEREQWTRVETAAKNMCKLCSALKP